MPRHWLLLSLLLATPSIADNEADIAESTQYTRASDEVRARWTQMYCWTSYDTGESHGPAWVDLSFTVTADGTVRDPRVLDSWACAADAIDSFEQSAIDAVLKFEYRPRIVDGEAVDVPDVRSRINFEREYEESDESSEQPTEDPQS